MKIYDSYSNQLIENHAEHGEIIVLLNEKEEIIFSNQEALSKSSQEFLSALSSRKQRAKGYETVKFMGQPFLLVEAESKNTGIRLVSLTPLSYIDSQAVKMRQSILVSGLWVWLFTILFIYMLLRLLTIPLRFLSTQMQKTGEGDFRSRIHVTGSTEICGLAESFNSMVSHIDQLIQRTYVAELSEKDAKLAALEAQLNPHFLYNTLQAVSTEALINEQPQLSLIHI